MKKNEKYYTPEIESFHVGFEYEEFNREALAEEGIWYKEICTSYLDGISDLLRNRRIRVKYLDEADIVEALKAQLYPTEADTGNHNKMFVFGRTQQHSIIFNPKSCRCVITLRDDIRKEDYTAFVGTIRNLSELRLIQKMVGIKK
jgi:hypothetical protein